MKNLSSVNKAFVEYDSLASGKEIEKVGLLVSDQKTWRLFPFQALNQPVFERTLTEFLEIPLGLIEPHAMMRWIENFNGAMTLHQLKARKIKLIESGTAVCKFSSMNDYGWLSNFYISIIFDEARSLIYPNVESGYVVFKAIKGLSESDLTTFARQTDPKQVKQQGKDLWHRESEQDDQEAISEMERLVFLKFSQNPILRRWLVEARADFEEFTGDPFWGTAFGKADPESSNQLGKILKRVQLALSS